MTDAARFLGSGRKHMRVMRTAPMLMLALAAPAAAANKESWGFVTSGSEALLVYGVPESDIVTLSFICDTRKRRIEIVSTVLPDKPTKGQRLTTTLRNGRASVTHDGRIGQSPAGEEFHFAVTVAAEPKAVAILKSGAALTIGIPRHQRHVPLRGVAKPLAQFEKACFR